MDIADQRQHHEFVVLTGSRRGTPAVVRIGAARRFEQVEVDRPLRRSVPGPAPKRILVVDPNAGYLSDAQRVLQLLGDVEICSEFSVARTRLSNRPPDLLITNLRLQEYNGLHLVHLAKPQTRCIVYSTHEDPVLAREAQEAGAFYEQPMRLARALAGYVHGALPPYDRRSPSLVDRRRFPRGGRRSADL
jgi:PleD family two-component response regulator